ncbi:MAG: hypothetical protein M3461_22810 [Pseudomonadota bacterium]|nr:hypothetical protein [Pseudomonadota bacterium]
MLVRIDSSAACNSRLRAVTSGASASMSAVWMTNSACRSQWARRSWASAQPGAQLFVGAGRDQELLDAVAQKLGAGGPSPRLVHDNETAS